MMIPLPNQDALFVLLESNLHRENKQVVHEIKNTNTICCLDLELLM